MSNLDLQKVVIEPVIGIIKSDKLFPIIDKVYFYTPEMEDAKEKKVSVYIVEKDSATTKVVAPILSALAAAGLMKYTSVIHSGKQADFDKVDFDGDKYITQNVIHVFENTVSYFDDAMAAVEEFAKVKDTGAYNSAVTAGQIALRKILVATCIKAELKEETEVLMMQDYMTMVGWMRAGLNIVSEYGIVMNNNHKNLTAILNLDLVSVKVADVVIEMLSDAIEMSKGIMTTVHSSEFNKDSVIEL